MASDKAGVGLAIVRIALGVFFLFEGIGKIAWLGDPGILAERFAGWLEDAPALSRWYLEAIAVPGTPLFARLVPLGELATGIAFLLGVATRWAGALAFFMVMNIHLASGALFEYRFLTNGYALPVLGPLLGLAAGGERLPWSVRTGRRSQRKPIRELR